MKNIIEKIRRKNGSALIIALSLMAMLTAIAIMAVNRSTTDVDLSYNQLHEERAFYLAESGISRATMDINNDNNWRIGYYRKVLDGGYYSVTLVDSITKPALYDSVVVTSEGYFEEGNAFIESWLVPEYQYPFQYSMFADAGLELKQGSCTDSYNSDSGSYSDTYLKDGGNVGTNDTLILSQDAIVGGDAQTATEGSMIIDGSSTVLGDTTTQADSVDLDIIPDSEYDWAKLVSNAPAGLSGTDYTYNNGTKSLGLKSGGVLTLQSGIYYFSDINLQSDAQINLAPGAEVTIYLTGDLTMQQFSTFNAGGSPADLLIFSKGSTFSMFQNTQFYGAFYGPNTVYKGRQDMGLYGSLVASEISLHQYTCFHYDRKLSKVKHGTTGKMYSVAWRVLQD